MPLRDHAGNAPSAVLTSDFGNTDLVAQCNDLANWPLGGGNGKFFVTFRRDSDDEERTLAASRSGNTLTFSALSDRGLEGTAAILHPAGSLVEHTFSMTEAVEANDHIFNTALDDHTQYHTAARHAGVTHTAAMLGVDSVTASQIAAGAVGSSELAAAAVIAGKIAAGTVTATELASNAVTQVKILNAAISLAKLDSNVVSFLVPTGIILPYGGSAAPTGYQLCNGAAISRATFAQLFAVIGTAYGVGNGSTTFNLPDLQQKFPLGKAAAGTGATLGEVGGAIDHVHSLGVTQGATGYARATIGVDASSEWPRIRRMATEGWTSTHRGGTSGASSVEGQTSGTELGGNTATTNPPYQVFNYIIKI
jgi:microcystin-dependent protein